MVSTSPALIHDLDMEKCEVEDTQFESDFELQIRGELLEKGIIIEDHKGKTTWKFK